jgi:predicted dehydrogenase
MRFGLLGTGHWAVVTQGAALAAHPRAEFAGVWGRNPEKARALAQRYGSRAYPDVDALIADVDAVAMALPPDVQAPLALRAARAGRHLLLEKPLALATAEADPIVHAVEEGGLASLVFFTNRFDPAIEAFVAKAAETGGWDGGRATHFSALLQPDSPYRGSAWRHERGGLWDVGPHALAALLPVLGPVAEVAAVDGPRGAAHVLLRHVSGAVGTLAVGVDARPAATASEFGFYGEAGVVTAPERAVTPAQAFAVAVDRLLANAAAGTVPDPCDVRFAREVVAVLQAADTSRREGRTVALG